MKGDNDMNRRAYNTGLEAVASTLESQGGNHYAQDVITDAMLLQDELAEHLAPEGAPPTLTEVLIAQLVGSLAQVSNSLAVIAAKMDEQ